MNRRTRWSHRKRPSIFLLRRQKLLLSCPLPHFGKWFGEITRRILRGLRSPAQQFEPSGCMSRAAESRQKYTSKYMVLVDLIFGSFGSVLCSAHVTGSIHRSSCKARTHHPITKPDANTPQTTRHPIGTLCARVHHGIIHTYCTAIPDYSADHQEQTAEAQQ